MKCSNGHEFNAPQISVEPAPMTVSITSATPNYFGSLTPTAYIARQRCPQCYSEIMPGNQIAPVPPKEHDRLIDGFCPHHKGKNYYWCRTCKKFEFDCEDTFIDAEK